MYPYRNSYNDHNDAHIYWLNQISKGVILNFYLSTDGFLRRLLDIGLYPKMELWSGGGGRGGCRDNRSISDHTHTATHKVNIKSCYLTRVLAN